MELIDLMTMQYVPKYSVNLTCTCLTLSSSKKRGRQLKKMIYEYRKNE